MGGGECEKRRAKGGYGVRYVIEGEWSGYSSGQRRVVHREVTDRAARADWCRRAGCILYTDGTRLDLTVREAKPRERVTEIHGYTSLIDECERENLKTVAGLSVARAARQAAKAAP